MSPPYTSAELLTGNERAPVEAELGELTPAEKPHGGGLLHGVPERLAAAMGQGENAWLRWADGQERSVRPAGTPRRDDQGNLIVAVLGEGTPPA